MEFRKEKTEKSKELIRKQFASDIFNISTGYYKSEKILPISQKPNENRERMIEFIPRYKELKHYERHFNNLLSDQQKHNSNINKLKPNYSHKNFELEIKRNRLKKIQKNCLDKNGNLSSKKLFLLDIYGKEDIDNNIPNNNANKMKSNHSNSKSIKEKRKNNNRFSFNKKMIIKKIPNVLDMNIINNNDKIKNIKYTYNKYYNNPFNKYNTNNNLKTIYIKKKPNINIINWTVNPYNNNYAIKKNYNSTNVSVDLKRNSQNKLKNGQSEKVFYGHPKSLDKVFYTETKEPILKLHNNIQKINKKENKEQQYFNILIQNDDLNDNGCLIDEKTIKTIFYKNGLHIYDLNEDGMNDLFTKKKIEAKLRKDINDENFEKNFRKVKKELNKYNINIDKQEMKDGKGFKNKNSVKQRKGTPGSALYKNIDKKDYNTELNTGFYK